MYELQLPSIGGNITNQEISKIFKCGNMGGMRSSTVTKTLVLISDHTKALYDDRWDGDTFYYTGMGKLGDQSIARANRTLVNAKEMGYTIHLFEVFRRAEYIYRGEVELAGKYEFENQPDSEGNPRKVIIFPLRLKEANTVDEKLIKELQETKNKEAGKLSDNELRTRAAASSSKSSKRIVKSTAYSRNEYVAEITKRRAKGHCELCGKPAPFKDKVGNPYLESHHIVWLSEGGNDNIQNTVALCPNCHRRMHVVADQSDVNKLKEIRKTNV